MNHSPAIGIHVKITKSAIMFYLFDLYLTNIMTNGLNVKIVIIHSLIPCYILDI